MHGLLRSKGLEKYYRLTGAVTQPAPTRAERDYHWLEPLQRRIDDGESARISVDVQGVHCSACVWVIEALFRKDPYGVDCLVNPARGRIDLTVKKGFALEAWARHVEELGYLLGPTTKRVAPERNLTVRMGVCLALAANAMMLSLALYFGLDSGRLHTLARQLVFAFCTTSMVVGGSWFVRTAVAGLRQRILHLDLPIAVGLCLAYAGSVWSFLRNDPRGEFFDTVAVFIALMLVGRWLQLRIVSQNRAQLLGNDGTDQLVARRIEGGRPQLVPCKALNAGDLLLLSPGDLVPVDVTLAGPGHFRLDWIRGESDVRAYASGSTVPAGAFSASRQALSARAATDFSQSNLISLLTPPAARPFASRFWDRVAKGYVLAVLALATIALAVWSASPHEALRVATAILVVTCPCAFGIAVPLAYEIVLTKARSRGLFVRSSSLLDRALSVRTIVFDKTGTLTVGTPVLQDKKPLEQLTVEELTILYTLAASSIHPKSLAIANAIDDVLLREDIVVTETLSRGVESIVDGTLYRLGQAGWASPKSAMPRPDDNGQIIFSRDTMPLAEFHPEETLRTDAKAEIEALEDRGYATYILSGDHQYKVNRAAERLGIPKDHAFGEHTAEDKAAWLDTRSAENDTLFVGDGINDTLAADSALVSGTPAIDRPFMPGRCDFYFVEPGLRSIRRLLTDARRLRRVIRADLVVALVYNAVAVALAMAGLVEPWVAAILMPLSSLTTIAFTTWALRPSQNQGEARA